VQQERHGSQLSEAKNKKNLFCPGQILLPGDNKKVSKISKGPRTVRCNVKKNVHSFANISETDCDILKFV
jgi:hypothetical protein